MKSLLALTLSLVLTSCATAHSPVSTVVTKPTGLRCFLGSAWAVMSQGDFGNGDYRPQAWKDCGR